MSKTGLLITNLQKYATRPEWEDGFRAVIEEHMASAATNLGIAPEDVGPLIGDESGSFIGIVFEDFATRRRADGNCMAADYLKRAGWRENGYARKYLEALIDSRLRLYEAIEVMPGESITLRALDTAKGSPEEPVFVHEKSGSQSLTRRDIICARVLHVHDEYILAGGVLALRADQTREILKHAIRRKKSDPDTDPMPTLCTTAWVAWLYAVQHAPRPQMVNRDGDDILMSKSRLPLLARADEIATIMNTLPDWESDPNHYLRWVWLANGKSPASSPKTKRKSAAASPAGTLLGEVVLEAKHLVFTSNSRQRMERGLLLLQQALIGKIGPALTSYEQMDLDSLPQQKPGPQATREEIPPDEQHGMILAILDRHYRETITQPIPALGNKTPMQAVKTKAGREKTIAWLKDLERGTARSAAQRGMPAYDFAWMWEQLGLGDER